MVGNRANLPRKTIVIQTRGYLIIAPSSRNASLTRWTLRYVLSINLILRLWLQIQVHMSQIIIYPLWYSVGINSMCSWGRMRKMMKGALGDILSITGHWERPSILLENGYIQDDIPCEKWRKHGTFTHAIRCILTSPLLVAEVLPIPLLNLYDFLAGYIWYPTLDRMVNH